MASTTIRVSHQTRALIHALAQADGLSMQETGARAVEAYRRHRLLRETNVAYAALRADPAAQAEWERDGDAWDETLADGLEDLT